MKFGILLLFFASLVSSCNAPTRSSMSQSQQAYVLGALRWDTSGGGDLAFEVTPAASAGEFLIHVTRYSFQGRNDYLRLSSADSATLADSMRRIFDGSLQILTGSPCQGYCGSFNKVTAVRTNGSSLDYVSPVAGNPNSFDDLYQFVTARI